MHEEASPTEPPVDLVIVELAELAARNARDIVMSTFHTTEPLERIALLDQIIGMYEETLSALRDDKCRTFAILCEERGEPIGRRLRASEGAKLVGIHRSTGAQLLSRGLAILAEEDESW